MFCFLPKLEFLDFVPMTEESKSFLMGSKNSRLSRVWEEHEGFMKKKDLDGIIGNCDPTFCGSIYIHGQPEPIKIEGLVKLRELMEEKLDDCLNYPLVIDSEIIDEPDLKTVSLKSYLFFVC